jgi:hypothetical protein
MVGIYGCTCYDNHKERRYFDKSEVLIYGFYGFTTISGSFLAKETRGAGYSFLSLDYGGSVRFHPDFALSPST